MSSPVPLSPPERSRTEEAAERRRARERRTGLAAWTGRRARDAWRRRSLVVTVALAVVTVGWLALRLAWPAVVVAAHRTDVRTLAVGGLVRRYRLHHPPRWDAEQALPLVLAFHGHQGSARIVEYESRLDEAADRAHVLVAYPDGTGVLPAAVAGWPILGQVLHTWNVGACCAPASGGDGRRPVDDVRFASAVVRTLVAEGVVDPQRVYATGFSIGGTLALKLACDRAGLVAAVASVEGTMPDTTCAPGRRVPVLFVRGGEDDELRADLQENRSQGSRYVFAESMRAALRFWARHDGCAGPVRRTPGVRVTRDSVAGCPAGVEAGMLLVHGNAHAWPGGRRPYLFAPRPAPGVPLSAWLLTFFLRHERTR